MNVDEQILINLNSPTARRHPARQAHADRRLAVEGAFQSLGQTLGETYLSAFALFLGAGGFGLGAIASIPTAATALAQLLGSRYRFDPGRTSRFIAGTWAVQAVGYLALGLSAFVAPAWALYLLIVVSCLTWGSGGFATPAWSALVAARIPPTRRGWFFALRGAAQQWAFLAATLLGGMLLGWSVSYNEAAGFCALFVAAALARAAGIGLLPGASLQAGMRRKPPELPHSWHRTAKVRRLAFYLWTLHFATHIATPFFVPYMLVDLNYSYPMVAVILATPALVKIATLRLWGRLADRGGPGPILRTTGWLVAPIPALWFISDSLWWILVAQVYSGLVWGAFELAQASAILQTTRGRASAIAWLNAIDGAMIIAGALIGGATVHFLGDRFGNTFSSPLALSTVLRFIPAIGLLWRVRGIGKPPWSHLTLPLRFWSSRPTRGLTFRPLAMLLTYTAGRTTSRPDGSPPRLIDAPPETEWHDSPPPAPSSKRPGVRRSRG